MQNVHYRQLWHLLKQGHLHVGHAEGRPVDSTLLRIGDYSLFEYEDIRLIERFIFKQFLRSLIQ